MRIKHAVKNVFLIFLTAVFLITPGMRVSAAKNVVFTVVNDRFLDLNDSTMPFEKGGKYYVPYSVFLSGFGGLKAYYSPEEQVLVFYDKEKIISFDIGHGYAYDQQMRTYGESAYSKGGTVFIPLSFVCSTWGFYYSVIPSSKGTVVRISRESSSLSDSMLLNIGETVMSSLLEKYGNKTPPETPGKPNGGETPVISEARKTVYLTFDAAPTEATAKILRSLSRYRYPATFFCAGDKMEAGDDIIRQIVISGHSVGLNAVSAAQDGKAGGAEKIIRQLNDGNEKLRAITKGTSRIARIAGGELTEAARDGLYNSGYRLWGYTIDASKKNTAYAISSYVTGSLKKTKRPAVVLLGSRDADARALGSILSFLKENNYYVLPIRDWDTPINAYQDIR